MADDNLEFPGKEFSHKDLQHFTDNFSSENFIGRTQFGILYRGKIPQNIYEKNVDENITKKLKAEDKCVTIKMWKTENIIGEDIVWRTLPLRVILARMKDEIKFLCLPLLESNKNVPKVLGHCFEGENLGVVYDLKPVNTIRNIMPNKEVFGWHNRIKVALGLARLLKLLHWCEPQYLVRNLSAAHVIVDQDFNPVVVDFNMIIGGDIGGENTLSSHATAAASYGYYDIDVALCGFWTMRTDVFNFGVILLELLFKRKCDFKGKPGKQWFVDHYARKFYESFATKAKNGGERSFYIHSSLQAEESFDAEDGDLLTNIAMDCVKFNRCKRPDIDEVLRRLENLHLQVDIGL